MALRELVWVIEPSPAQRFPPRRPERSAQHGIEGPHDAAGMRGRKLFFPTQEPATALADDLLRSFDGASLREACSG